MPAQTSSHPGPYLPAKPHRGPRRPPLGLCRLSSPVKRCLPPPPRPRSGAARREPPPERVSLPAPEAGSGGPPGPFSPTRRGKPPLPTRRGGEGAVTPRSGTGTILWATSGKIALPRGGRRPPSGVTGEGRQQAPVRSAAAFQRLVTGPRPLPAAPTARGAASPPHPRRAPALPAAIAPAPLQRRSAPHGRLKQFTYCHCNGERDSRAYARHREQTVFVNRG